MVEETKCVLYNNSIKFCVQGGKNMKKRYAALALILGTMMLGSVVSASEENVMEVITEAAEETEVTDAEATAAEEVDPELLAKAQEWGADGVKNTTDTSVEFTTNGSLSNPASIGELGKIYYMNYESNMYEQIGVRVVSVEAGEEVNQFVEDEVINSEDDLYNIGALRRDEEYRLVTYEVYLPTDFTDREYGYSSIYCYFEITADDGDRLYYDGRGYYVDTNSLYSYDYDTEYHPGDTIQLQDVIIMPTEITDYNIQFSFGYGMEDYAFNVAITE